MGEGKGETKCSSLGLPFKPPTLSQDLWKRTLMGAGRLICKHHNMRPLAFRTA